MVDVSRPRNKDLADPSEASDKEINAIKAELRKILSNEANDDMSYGGSISPMQNTQPTTTTTTTTPQPRPCITKILLVLV